MYQLPDCGGLNWNLIVDKYGIPGLVILFVGMLIWFKVWPTFDKSLSGITENSKNISETLSNLVPEIKTMIADAKDHEANTREALKEIQGIANEPHERRTTTRRATK